MINDFSLPNFDGDFFSEIEELVITSNSSYLDATIHWCAERGIEVEYIANLIAKNPALKAKLQCEAEDLHFLPKTTRVPI